MIKKNILLGIILLLIAGGIIIMSKISTWSGLNNNAAETNENEAGDITEVKKTAGIKMQVVPELKETAMNPIITSIYTADPSAHVWEDGKLYIYASHDMDPPRGCDLMDRYHVFSTEDMVNWVDEGEILSSDDVSWGRPEGGFMWAPDCAYKDGTYYFYYPHPSGSDWNNTWKIGVATSKKPASDFVDQGYMEGIGGFAMIDPCVFVDDDGQAYMYYGGGSRCQGAKLGDDMMSLASELQDMTGLEDFHEATWVFKRNGIYYLAYSDNKGGANQMRYAVSDNPLGPWTYKGIFLEPTGCDTSHGSIAEYKGQWYLFYHNQALSGQGNLRTMCIDYLYFNDDGTIKMVEQTRKGVAAVGGTAEEKTVVKYEAEDSVVGGGATIEDKEDGSGKIVTDLQIQGSYCQFDNVDGGEGTRATIRVYYATGEGVPKLRLTVNDKDYSYLNALTTWGWKKYTGCTYLTVRLDPGETNTIRLYGGNGSVNLDYITVELLSD